MWKTIRVKENPVIFTRSSTPEGNWMHLTLPDGCEGKHIRVTVEEEVSECCEKWRGKSIYTIDEASRFQAGGTVLMHQEPEFCPRCGRKL